MARAPLPTASPRSPNINIPPRPGQRAPVSPNPGAVPPVGAGQHWQQIAAFNAPPAAPAAPAAPPATPGLTPGQQATQARQQAADARRQAEEGRQQQRKQIQANQQGADLATKAGQAVNHAIGGTLDPAKRWIEGLPTPGGIGLMLLVLVFFIFAIIPVNHKRTRFQLIYLTLTGAETLDDGVYDGQTVSPPSPTAPSAPGGIIGGPNPGNPFPQGM